jgi:dienelactone hydrolase
VTRQTLLGPHTALLNGLPARAALAFAARPRRSLAAWRTRTRARLAAQLLLPDTLPSAVAVRVESRRSYDGLLVEELSWTMPWGPRTRAVFARPLDATGRLPAVLGLHDHSGFKAMGYEKIVAFAPRVHPRLRRHHTAYYGGRPWLTELARRGFAVLAHDGFLFGSRRQGGDGFRVVPGRVDKPPTPTSSAGIDEYNEWANRYENVVARSIFSTGLTLPGIAFCEDRIALGVLAARREVDADRIGCAGLSSGGRRAVLLAALDDRIRAAVTVGFMTTWRDFAAHRSYAHSWEVYIPGLPRLLDFPDILSLHMPRPTLVQSLRDDHLFSYGEAQRAQRKLREAFRAAGASDALRQRFYPGPHRFSIEMQDDAFAWLARHLGK